MAVNIQFVNNRPSCCIYTIFLYVYSLVIFINPYKLIGFVLYRSSTNKFNFLATADYYPTSEIAQLIYWQLHQLLYKFKLFFCNSWLFRHTWTHSADVYWQLHQLLNKFKRFSLQQLIILSRVNLLSWCKDNSYTSSKTSVVFLTTVAVCQRKWSFFVRPWLSILLLNMQAEI